MDHQIIVVPKLGANRYDKATLVPKEITVNTTEIPGLPIPR